MRTTTAGAWTVTADRWLPPLLALATGALLGWLA